MPSKIAPRKSARSTQSIKSPHRAVRGVNPTKPSKSKIAYSKRKPKAAHAKAVQRKASRPSARQAAPAQRKAAPRTATPAITASAFVPKPLKPKTSKLKAAASALTPKKMQEAVVAALADVKAQDISVLDVRKLTDVADFLVIASGTSSRHVAGMADRVVEEMRKHGRRPIGVEGKDLGEWVLIDFGDVVAHIMRPQTRDFYNLEKLWSQDIVGRGESDDSLERYVRARMQRR